MSWGRDGAGNPSDVDARPSYARKAAAKQAKRDCFDAPKDCPHGEEAEFGRGEAEIEAHK